MLIAAVVGIILSYSEVGTRWEIRLREFLLDSRRLDRILFDFLGKKQALDTVESHNLAREILLDNAVDCRIKKGIK